MSLLTASVVLIAASHPVPRFQARPSAERRIDVLAGNGADWGDIEVEVDGANGFLQWASGKQPLPIGQPVFETPTPVSETTWIAVDGPCVVRIIDLIGWKTFFEARFD